MGGNERGGRDGFLIYLEYPIKVQKVDHA